MFAIFFGSEVLGSIRKYRVVDYTFAARGHLLKEVLLELIFELCAPCQVSELQLFSKPSSSGLGGPFSPESLSR
jgi:hypothetical protein